MHVTQIESSLNLTYNWLNEFKEYGHLRDESQSYSVLRIVLHELRDHLPVDVSAHLAAQLPLVLKGLYFDGWDPSREIRRVDSFEDFIKPIRKDMTNLDVNLKESVRNCIQFIISKIEKDLADKVMGSLPERLKDALLVS
ncbi:Uncharacterized conserved protein (DUF2267) [Legionella lansingensis]|uniref:DUF2267 domain-containing protein n=1 Tax=Legionella lansingensis TaxID=45067 RepID=A0A0W0VSC9_9GAMM|nr:DUF2267 domain-containing protein [Legionella lansingensis]KTD22861.1 hypothetical protein Llan_0978 [Legionella lansingensis]SNV53667.1 Uncharacterized conserved protein (DUF2267) [Legionella lansingensis]